MHIRDFKHKLTPLAYHVCVEHGTEPPFSGRYVHPGHEGMFLCVGCETVLFCAHDQYDSKSGWPSFTQPAEPDAVEYKQDDTGKDPRTEVHCARCQSHLGHVFDDGPGPHQLRYCINSVALVLEDAREEDGE